MVEMSGNGGNGGQGRGKGYLWNGSSWYESSTGGQVVIVAVVETKWRKGVMEEAVELVETGGMEVMVILVKRGNKGQNGGNDEEGCGYNGNKQGQSAMV